MFQNREFESSIFIKDLRKQQQKVKHTSNHTPTQINSYARKF
jgi:hypothetical protein